MSVPDRVIMFSPTNEPDPLLRDFISTHGYEVTCARSWEQLTDMACHPSVAAVAILGNSEWAKVSEQATAIASLFPQAKVLLCVPEGCEIMPGLGDDIGKRTLVVHGEAVSQRNAARIRRFLAGDGYHWASDLAAPPAAFLDGAIEMSEQHQEQTRRLLQFAADLSKFTDLHPMLQEALRRCLDLVECEAGSIYLWDESTDTLVLDAAMGPESDKRLGLRQRLGEGLAGWVAEVGESILVTDTRKVGKLKGRVCRRYSNCSCIAVPITHGGQLFGVICLTMPRNNRSFEPSHLRLAEALAQKLAGVIRPLNVLTELRRFSERLLGAFQTSTDLVYEKDAQVETLRALHANILDNMPLAVISYDVNLHMRSANRLAKRLFDADAGGTNADARAPLEGGIEFDRNLWRRKLQSVVEGGRKIRLHRIGYRSGERDLILELHISPLRDTAGVTIGGIIMAQDVTDDVAMEAKLSSAERLALIGRLAAKVAHELNNPLDGILRFLNLALRQLDQPEKARTYLEECRNGLLRMGNILTQLLTFSRSQRAGQRPSSLTHVIRQSLAQFELRAQEANIRLAVDVPPDLPLCPSDDIWEVFANVIKNALDAMKENGVLRIVARAHAGEVRVTISDTGPGVPPEMAEKIFEPFFTTKKAGHGTGLGLTLCRDTLRRIGGDIRLLPSEKGATFEIVIPVEERNE